MLQRSCAAAAVTPVAAGTHDGLLLLLLPGINECYGDSCGDNTVMLLRASVPPKLVESDACFTRPYTSVLGDSTGTLDRDRGISNICIVLKCSNAATSLRACFVYLSLFVFVLFLQSVIKTAVIWAERSTA